MITGHPPVGTGTTEEMPPPPPNQFIQRSTRHQHFVYQLCKCLSCFRGFRDYFTSTFTNKGSTGFAFRARRRRQNSLWAQPVPGSTSRDPPVAGGAKQPCPSSHPCMPSQEPGAGAASLILPLWLSTCGGKPKPGFEVLAHSAVCAASPKP